MRKTTNFAEGFLQLYSDSSSGVENGPKKNKSVVEDRLDHPSGVEDGPNLSAVCQGRQNGRRADSLIDCGKFWIMLKEKPLYVVNRPSAMQAGPNLLSVMQDVWKPCARQRASQTETFTYHARRRITLKEKKV